MYLIVLKCHSFMSPTVIQIVVVGFALDHENWLKQMNTPVLNLS